MRNPVSRFTYAPVDLDMKRSRFTRSSTHKTTFDAGKLIPFYVDEYLPGDTFSLSLNSLIRMSTPIFPVMDNCYLDVYFFAVPNRLVWDHWREFMGESPSDPYLNPVQYSVPQLKSANAPDFDVAFGSILDYMGVPAGTTVDSISALPVRAYCEIWNQWFRDQNLQNAININKGDSDQLYYPQPDHYEPIPEDPDYYITQCGIGGLPAPVNKYHDYFTSALLQPQKGDPVAIPINGFVPVYAVGNSVNAAALNQPPIIFTDDLAPGVNAYLIGSDVSTSSNKHIGEMYGSPQANISTSRTDAYFANLYANLGGALPSDVAAINSYATINDLRYAFQIQKLLEADNRYGTRYIEIIKGHFGVDSPDGLLQRPEFLGGKRIPINIQQVIQTSATDETSPQGNTAAYSLTLDNGVSFTKSFTEHGYIIGVCCVRTMHTYQQGVERFWNRKDRYDYYFPELANISEQPILNKEIWNGSSTQNSPNGIYNKEQSNEYFGFQEAWADYRMKPNRVSGFFRSTYNPFGGSLDSWHYADFYTEQPRLSSEWIRETPVNIDRTLAVQSDISDQFLADFYIDLNCTRVMPIYSIPGLADHH